MAGLNDVLWILVAHVGIPGMIPSLMTVTVMPHTSVAVAYANVSLAVVVVVKDDDVALFELTGIIGDAIIPRIGAKAVNAPLAVIVFLLEERRIVRPGFRDPVYAAVRDIAALAVGHGFTTGVDVGADFAACPAIPIDGRVAGRITFRRL